MSVLLNRVKLDSDDFTLTIDFIFDADKLTVMSDYMSYDKTYNTSQETTITNIDIAEKFANNWTIIAKYIRIFLKESIE